MHFTLFCPLFIFPLLKVEKYTVNKYATKIIAISEQLACSLLSNSYCKNLLNVAKII